ncbi:MAG: hypothetical protein N2589_02900, partial [bacterium]|nr:hypothetical protein [bacterium]
MKKYILLFIFLTGCISQISTIEKEKCDIFVNRKDAIFSPEGSINPSDVAFSLNGEYFTRQLQPYNSGKIGIFSKNGQLLKEINTLGEEEENNDIKGIAWHPNSYVVGVIYHKNGYSDLRLFEVFNGELLRRIIVGNFYHYFVFDEKGEKIYLSVDGKKIEKINLRNTDFVINSGINLPWLNYGWDIGRNPWNKEHGG